MAEKQDAKVVVEEEESIWTNHAFDMLFNKSKKNLSLEVLGENYGASSRDVVS